MSYFIDIGLVTKEASRTIYNAQAASILLTKIPTMMKVVLLTYTALNKTGTIHIR